MTENIVIVGAVAVGAKAACRFKRLRQDANVTIIDKDELISYGGCGIPFYVAGDVSDETELRSTSFHMVRDEKFFLNDKGVVAMTGTEVTKIDRSNKTVHIKKNSGKESDISYDKLVLATGSVPRQLDMPGTNLKNVFNVSNLRDAIAIKKKITQGQVEKAVIIGAGFIGLEMAQALADMWEIDTTVIEYFDQVMPGFVSRSISLMAQRCMEKNEVKFHLEEIVQALEGDEYVTGVKTNKRTLPADMVIMSVGIVPNTILAKEAGIETGPGGHIIVNDRMQTSDPDIYSGGDCVLIKNLVTGKPAYFPLGSMANRQGRVIGTNLAGGDGRFKGGVGSFVVKIFEKSLAGAGLSIDMARKEGFDAVSVQVAQFDRAHFYPEKEIIYLELVVDRKTRTVLGIQGWGGEGSEMVGRINAVVPLIINKAKVEDVSNLEIAYSPPFASAMDIVNALGNTTENFLDGMYKPMQMEEFIECWKSRNNGECYFLDCRADADAIPFQEKFPEIWKSIPHDELERRCDEVPRDKKIILLCNTGIRSYEAQINLAAHGIDDTVSVESGISGLKDCGIEF
jgi:NADPH-dependent 2,4-dienoyl-CoA reductase/sulfur reductase-like enzyme/rhodanese-related sulfurtransferase